MEVPLEEHPARGPVHQCVPPLLLLVSSRLATGRYRVGISGLVYFGAMLIGSSVLFWAAWSGWCLCDGRVGHPVNKFVPSDVPIETLGLLGAATDWYAFFVPTRRPR